MRAASSTTWSVSVAAQAIAAGLVDEYHLFITTSVVGGGKRFFPDGVRLDLALPDPLSRTASPTGGIRCERVAPLVVAW